jgi:hypothetical protein
MCSVYKEKIKMLENDLKLTRANLDKVSKQLEEFNSKINKIKEQPILDLSEEFISELCEKNFTQEHFIKGLKGIAEFIFTFIIKNGAEYRYKRIDNLKSIFLFNDGQKLVKDSKFKILIISIFPFLDKIISRIYKECLKNYFKDNEADKGAFDELVMDEPEYKDEDSGSDDQKKDKASKSSKIKKSSMIEEDLSDAYRKIFLSWRGVLNSPIRKRILVAELETYFENDE